MNGEPEDDPFINPSPNPDKNFRRTRRGHQENIDFTYRALSVLNTAYCDLMMFLSPIKQKVSKPVCA